MLLHQCSLHGQLSDEGLRWWRRPSGLRECRCLALGGGCLGGIRLGELAAEAVDAACGIDELLLAGEEGVAGGTDFDHDVALVGGLGLEVVAAGALDLGGVVAGVNS